jgi:2-dehydropantoate 2-reductase
VVCKYGDKYDVPTPFNDLVVEIIHGIEDGKYPLRFDNIRFFENLF